MNGYQIDYELSKIIKDKDSLFWIKRKWYGWLLFYRDLFILWHFACAWACCPSTRCAFHRRTTVVVGPIAGVPFLLTAMFTQILYIPKWTL